MTDVTIVMTTWIPEGKQGRDRLAAEELCLNSWQEHLINKDAIHLHLADDGSTPYDFAQIRNFVDNWKMGQVTYSKQDRRGVGASLNVGLKKAFENSPIVLHAVDDWELLDDLWLTPWVSFMEDVNYDVGAVRFFPHPYLTGEIRHIPPHGWAMMLERHHYVFATRPSLWHKRMFDALGYFKEEVSALDCETDFNYRICKPPHKIGDRIWLAIPELWRPKETGSLSALVPA